MKKFYVILVLISFFLACPVRVVFSAENILGKVVDVFGDGNATIQIDGKHNLKAGDNIDLTYMAGVLPMMVGVYEITAVQNNIVLCKPVSITIPADKGMYVQIDVITQTSSRGLQEQNIKIPGQESSVGQSNATIMDTVPRGHRDSSSSEDYSLKHSTQEVPDMKISGEVVKVMGTDVRIKLISHGDPRIGSTVDLSYVTSSGVELPVGTWKVVDVKQREVIAVANNKNVKPRVGMKAIIYTKEEQTIQDTDVHLSQHSLKEKDVVNRNSGVQRIGTLNDLKRILKDREGDGQELATRGAYAASIAKRYWLGVEIAKNNSTLGQAIAIEPEGVRVFSVFPKSPAAKAGIKVADIIYEANGVKVIDVQQFIDIINSSPRGKLKIKIQRDGKILKKTIRLKKK